MSVDWTQGSCGQVVQAIDLKPEMVRLKDIARGLACEYRFGKFTKQPYSVAQHCVEGSELISNPFKLPFLLHELSEVYLPDVQTPLKSSLQWAGGPIGGKWSLTHEALEEQHASVMLHALGLAEIFPVLKHPAVKHMDLAMLAAEKRDLMLPELQPWGLTVPAVPKVITAWGWEKAEDRFLAAFWNLKSQWPYVCSAFYAELEGYIGLNSTRSDAFPRVFK